jgi:methyltransferase
MSEAFFLLTFLTLQRLLELVISRRNTKNLLARGAKEFGSQHYIYMVLLHGSWIVLLWIFGGQNEVSYFWLAIFIILQFGRLWVLFTLKTRWTTRIIVLPNAKLVEDGPFRFFKHPNYWDVVGEIAVVPLALGLIWVAAIYTVLNAWMLWVRIGVENDALGSQ